MTARTYRWINAIAFQLTWLAAVGGAGTGRGWIGPLAFALFFVGHLRSAPGGRADVRLVAIACAAGFCADSALARSGLVTYAAAAPGSPWAPAWIVALWGSLALTLRHSLAFLGRRPLLAATLGALSAPLSYLIADRAWRAVTLAEPLARTLLALAVSWALLMPALSAIATRSRPAPADRPVAE